MVLAFHAVCADKIKLQTYLARDLWIITMFNWFDKALRPIFMLFVIRSIPINERAFPFVLLRSLCCLISSLLLFNCCKLYRVSFYFLFRLTLLLRMCTVCGFFEMLSPFIFDLLIFFGYVACKFIPYHRLIATMDFPSCFESLLLSSAWVMAWSNRLQIFCFWDALLSKDSLDFMPL